MQPTIFQEQVFFSTVRIVVSSTAGSGDSIGTGFLLHAPLNNPANQGVLLLITNRHVFGDPPQPVSLVFHKKNADGSGPSLAQTTEVRADSLAGIFVGHPDANVDLACLNVSVVAHNKYHIFSKNLFPDMLCDFGESDLLPGMDIWFIGYPENRFDIAHNLPILRKGCIASIPEIDFNGERQLVIDAQVFPGSSGSPVFVVLGGKVKLLGVVSQTMIRNQQLQISSTGEGVGIEQVIGLGIVIKATVVKELVDHAISQLTR